MEATTTLKEEIEITILWLAKTDMNIYGYITEGTKEAAKMQNVTLPDYEKTK